MNHESPLLALYEGFEKKIQHLIFFLRHERLSCAVLEKTQLMLDELGEKISKVSEAVEYIENDAENQK